MPPRPVALPHVGFQMLPIVLNGSNLATSSGGEGEVRISGDGSMLWRPLASTYGNESVTDVAAFLQMDGGRPAQVGVTLAVMPGASQLLVGN